MAVIASIAIITVFSMLIDFNVIFAGESAWFIDLKQKFVVILYLVCAFFLTSYYALITPIRVVLFACSCISTFLTIDKRNGDEARYD